mgnify:CR=1 FL=1
MHRRTVLTAGILFPTLYSLASSAALAADLPQLAFPEMYSGVSVLGLTFSDKLKSLAGKRVRMQGFMRRPKGRCPFLRPHGITGKSLSVLQHGC